MTRSNDSGTSFCKTGEGFAGWFCGTPKRRLLSHCKVGDPGGIRTHDHSIKRRIVYFWNQEVGWQTSAKDMPETARIPGDMQNLATPFVRIGGGYMAGGGTGA